MCRVWEWMFRLWLYEETRNLARLFPGTACCQHCSRVIQKGGAHWDPYIYIWAASCHTNTWCYFSFWICVIQYSLSLSVRGKGHPYSGFMKNYNARMRASNTHTICPPRWQIAATAISFAGSSVEITQMVRYMDVPLDRNSCRHKLLELHSLLTIFIATDGVVQTQFYCNLCYLVFY